MTDYGDANYRVVTLNQCLSCEAWGMVFLPFRLQKIDRSYAAVGVRRNRKRYLPWGTPSTTLSQPEWLGWTARLIHEQLTCGIQVPPDWHIINSSIERTACGHCLTALERILKIRWMNRGNGICLTYAPDSSAYLLDSHAEPKNSSSDGSKETNTPIYSSNEDRKEPWSSRDMSFCELCTTKTSLGMRWTAMHNAQLVVTWSGIVRLPKSF